MSQAIMFRDNVKFRAVLQALGAPLQLQDDQGDPESGAALLGRLEGDDQEDIRAMPELLVAGINRDGCLIFIKARKEQTKSRPIWINLAVPPPERFRLVPHDPPTITEQLAEFIDLPPGGPYRM